MESLDGATSAECFCSTRCTTRVVLETYTKPYGGVKNQMLQVFNRSLDLCTSFLSCYYQRRGLLFFHQVLPHLPSSFILDFVCVRRSAGNYMLVLLGWLDCFSDRTALCQQNHPSSTAFKNCRLGALRFGPRCKLIDC